MSFSDTLVQTLLRGLGKQLRQAVTAVDIDEKTPIVAQPSQMEAILRSNGRKEYIPVVFSPSLAEWSLASSASPEQISRLRSPNRSIHISGSQHCIRTLQFDTENYRNPCMQTGQMLEITTRNAFKHGDLAKLKIATDDIFHIENFREYLLHVATFGTASTVTASHGGSMKHLLVKSSDFEDIEENPNVMEECKKAFWKLFCECFISTVYFHMSIGNKASMAIGTEIYVKKVIKTVESRQLVQHCNSQLHPGVRSAMYFFQNIWPGVPEETACPDLRFLWTLRPELVSSSLWWEDHPAEIQLPLAQDRSMDSGPFSPHPCGEYFSKEARAQLKAEIEEHNSRIGKDVTSYGSVACFCIECKAKDTFEFTRKMKAAWLDGSGLKNRISSKSSAGSKNGDGLRDGIGSQSDVGLKNGNSPKHGNGLKNGNDLKNDNDLKNGNGLKNGNDLKNGVLN